MTEAQIVNTLHSKREELETQIAAYEMKVEALRHDLLHVNATLRMFELNGEHEVFPIHMRLTAVFKRFEISKLCLEALADEPHGLDTRELAVAVIRAKGLDDTDAVLRKAMGYRIVQSLSQKLKRGKVGSSGKRNGVRIWTNLSQSSPKVS